MFILQIENELKSAESMNLQLLMTKTVISEIELEKF